MVIRLSRPIRVELDDGPPRYPVKEFLALLRRWIYRGDRVECSCCGGTYSLLLYSPYMTALCPYCLSVERYRLLCRFLREETDFGKRKMRVLDVAPLWCFQEFCRSFQNIDYVSVDIASPYAMRRMDIMDIDFKDNSFDCIICYHVLEHIDDDMKALREIYRVLKPGGWAVIQVPILVEKTAERHDLTEKEQDDYIKWDDHLRVYGKDFAKQVEQAGFRLEISDYVKRFTEEEIRRFGLDPSEELYLCHKDPA